MLFKEIFLRERITRGKYWKTLLYTVPEQNKFL